VLGNNAFETKLAGMREDRWAVAFKVLAVLDAGRRLGDELFEPRLALLEGPGPPVFAVELEQIEGIEKRLAVMGPAVQLLTNTATPASSQQTASPSIVTDSDRNAATAALMRG
jgi:hypothetical protein